MRKSWPILIFLFLGNLFNADLVEVTLPQAPSVFGTEDNPQARLDFELMRLRNPKTGKIPRNIRSAELNFQRDLPRRRSNFKSQQTDNWEFAGPANVGGRTRAVAIDFGDPTDQTIIAAGVSGGIWKTTNGGVSWVLKSHPNLRNGATTVAQDTRLGKNNNWYIGTGELLGNSARLGTAPFRGDGILKSIDGGETWSRLPSTQDSDPSRFGSQFQYIWNLVVDHSADPSEDVVLVAAYGGILRSSDGGETWAVVLGEKLFDLPVETDLNEINAPFYTNIIQTKEGAFYAWLSPSTGDDNNYPNHGLYYSSDGIQWSFILSRGSTRMVMDINANGGYLLTTNNARSDLFRIDILGYNEGIPTVQTSLRRLPDFDDLGEFNTQEGYNLMVKMHPQDDELVFLGATNLYRSSDGFQTPESVSWIGGYDPETNNGRIYENHHPDQHDLLFFKSDPNIVLSANDGGLQQALVTKNNDVSWTSLNNGFVTSQFYTIHIPQWGVDETIVGGLQDNGTYLTDLSNPNVDWVQVLGGDGAYAQIAVNYIYSYFSFQNAGIYQFGVEDDELTFARVDPDPDSFTTNLEYLFINPFVLDPHNYNVMYLAGGDKIWRNSNLVQIPLGSQEPTSVNWDFLAETQIPKGLITSLEISPASDHLYYGSSSGHVYSISNPQNNDIATLLASFGDDRYVSSISSNPMDEREIMVTISNYNVPSIFYSDDGGSTMIDVSGNLEENLDGTGNGPSIRWAEIVPIEDGSTNRYYVGTSVGLYSTENMNETSTNWEKESEELVGSSVITMMDYRPLDGRMVIGTHGNGVFRASIQDAFLFEPRKRLTPEKFIVHKNFPNPFSEITNIVFEIPKLNYVSLDIFDVKGHHIRNLLHAPQFEGRNEVTWDGRNWLGESVMPGVYIYRISYDGNVVARNMIYNP